MKSYKEIIEEFSEARRNGFVEVKELKDQGKKVIGVYCGFAPWEILASNDVVVAWLCGMSEEPIPAAEKDLPRNSCPLLKSSYGFAITESCPYYYFSDMLIGETTCDGKKKMYEYLGQMKPMYIMSLPQNLRRESSFDYYKDELYLLKEAVEKVLDIEISEEDIRKNIIIRNNERKALREFYELGKLFPPPIWGFSMRKVLEATKYIADKENEIKNIKLLTESIKENYKLYGSEVPSEAKRILITGSPLGEATEKIIKIIEENGGVVVCYENCSSTKSIDDLVDEKKNAFDALAERYLKTACACMSPNDNRLNMINHYISKYKIDGVMDMVLYSCHTYNCETYRVKNICNKNNTPYMSIETDYSSKDIGQLTTRISAFIEMLD
ncbi:double-cubane-cluster-containing anaerobic reductase [Clostridium hydrogeniformans]|uniref:double-cubane-cluster-containing anaerobic reductase n=1 Tax=Clostridium hydrogeniformans TaxID=349933 RepID=UPI00048792EE|nr:double-cubane-cluster-containing anaerobic reductase [Clostridium hydrogeniformans]